jgi:PBSX family phage terminase large subunit
VSVDLFADTKFKPFARGKQRDSFTLSDPGLAEGHIFEGAVRSSKTIVSLIRWLLFVIEGPPGNLLMMGKTERTLKRNVIEPLQQLLGKKRVRFSAGAGEIVICGRTVFVAGANNELAVEKIQGLTLVGFYGDEAPTWPQSVFDMARTRCSEPGAAWFITGNPASSTHHLKTDWIDRAKLHLTRDGKVIRRSMNAPGTQDVHVYSFTIYDNPFLTPEFVASLERSYTGVFRRRNILGEWCMAEGAIYDMWDPERHVIDFEQIPQLDRWIGVGVDYGTINPFHAGDLAIGPAPRGQGGKALYVTSEYRYDSRVSHRQMSNREYAQAMQTWLRRVPHPAAPQVRGFHPDTIAVDPSATYFRVELHKMGITSTGADNRVLAGIADVSSLIAADRFYVCRQGAPELIKEFPDYAWDPKAAQRGEDAPLKQKDHGLDQVRYISRTTRHEWWDDVLPDVASLDYADA